MNTVSPLLYPAISVDICSITISTVVESFRFVYVYSSTYIVYVPTACARRTDQLCSKSPVELVVTFNGYPETKSDVEFVIDIVTLLLEH